MSEILKIRSSLSTDLMRHVLMRGSLLAAIGIGLMAYAGTFFSLQTLHDWGWIIYALAIGLITFGLLPYRKLGRLEKKPHQIILGDDDTLIFYFQGKKTFSIPLEIIEKTDFQQDKYKYGIKIFLKKPVNNKIIIHDPSFNMQRFMAQSHKSYNCDLFLPYFSKRGFELLDNRHLE